MTEQTSRLAITYPSEQQQPFFDDFQQGMTEVDSLHFAHLDALNTQLFGGGNVTWNGASASPLDQFSFSSNIIFISPSYGSVATWSQTESPVTIPLGNFLVALLNRGTLTSYALSKFESSAGADDPTIIVTDKVPVDSAGRAQVIAYHAQDGKLYIPTGLTIGANATSTEGLRPAGGVGSGDLSNEQYLTMTASANLTNERVLVVVPAALKDSTWVPFLRKFDLVSARVEVVTFDDVRIGTFLHTPFGFELADTAQFIKIFSV